MNVVFLIRNKSSRLNSVNAASYAKYKSRYTAEGYREATDQELANAGIVLQPVPETETEQEPKQLKRSRRKTNKQVVDSTNSINEKD